ncbi:MAG: DEAD/DEAH box helicase family protein [Fusobacteriaceae bacterium]|nr:DEAD/DEAH box helicase family protein [Fusobacteriaceae bacterium]
MSNKIEQLEDFIELERQYYYEKNDKIFSKIYYSKKLDTIVIIDTNLCNTKDVNNCFLYREYTNSQNLLMKKHTYLYRILEEDIEIEFEFIKNILLQQYDIPYKPKKNIKRDNGDMSFLEHYFENVFLELYGEDSFKYLRKEEQLIGFHGENIFIDYAIEKQNSKIAVEENGESYHHPQKIGVERYRAQLMKQNAIVFQGYKIFRFSMDEVQFKERMVDEMKDFFGEKSHFVSKKSLYEDRQFKLYEHQDITLKQLEEMRENDINSSVVVYPTGTGKSKIGEEDIKIYLEKNKDAKVALVVPTVNLKNQWIDNFKKLDTELSIGEDPENQIYVTTYNGLCRKKNEYSQDKFDYILVDEAHHAVAPTTVKTIQHFKPKFMLGLTATPDRLDNIKLENIFSKVEREMDLKEAIEKNILSPIRCFRVKSNIDLSEVRFNGKKFVNSDLEKTIVVESRNTLIADVVKKYFGDTELKKQGIIFCVSIKHAEKMAKLLNERGIKAKAVSGKDKKSEEYLQEYIDEKIQFLCSCSLITEGWDAPKTSVVVMARPTLSKVLYCQQLGRGTRKAENKECLYVIDVVDNYGSVTVPWSANSLFRNPSYIPFGNVLTCERDNNGELFYLDHLLEREEKIEEVNIFSFEEMYGGYLSIEEVARELFISTSSIRNWIKKGEVIPDFTLKIGNGDYNLFKSEKIDEIRVQKGLKKRNEDTILVDFWEFIEEKDYSLSYKIVFILSLIKTIKSDGEANFFEVKNTYAQYYLKRIEQKLIVDRKACKYDIDFLNNDKQLITNIITNPFEKFERKRFILHSDDKENIGFNYFLWNKVAENSKKGIEEFKIKLKEKMIEHLKEYYNDLGGIGDISCFEN